MAAALPERLGHLLLHHGYLSDDQLRIAVQEQTRHPQRLGEVAIRLGFVSEATLRDVLAEQLGQHSVSLDDIEISPAIRQLIPATWAQRHQVLPLTLDPATGQLTLAMADPDDLLTLDQLRRELHDAYQLIPRRACASELQRAIARHYGSPEQIDSLLGELVPQEMAAPAALPENGLASPPLVKLVDALLGEAVAHNASDLHFEPESGFLRIRCRLDGVLRQTHSLHKAWWPSLLVRLKVMSGMNIAETRAPQDGHFSLSLAGRSIDFRAASHPGLHGENFVLRILDRQRGIVPLAQLGLDAEALVSLAAIMAKPEGIVLVTGPTGSGKTTTLYSILSQLNHESVNIMTLEDPVEYPLEQIRQTSLNETAKLDFASGIRSLMRQDPDIILVGEIRDQPTAEMAFRAAMTGHQVYATLHTHSALGVIPRLLDIGILPDIMAGNISGILAQRLVRLLCPHCKRTAPADRAEQKMLRLTDAALIARPVGCAQCQQQGYLGRRAIVELLPLDEEFDELIARRASLRSLRQHAQQQQFRPLAEQARQLVRDGLTSLAEAARVVDLGERLH